MSRTAGLFLEGASAVMAAKTLVFALIFAVSNDVLTLAVATLKNLNDQAPDLPNLFANNTPETTTRELSNRVIK